MYWRISSFPELGHLSDSERDQLLGSTIGRGLMVKLALSCVLRGLLAGLLVTGVVVTWTAGASSPPSGILAVILSPICVALLSLGLYQFSLIRIRGQLRIYLHQQRQLGKPIPVCLKCGYAVDEQAGRCPECGATL
ncbi:MAG: hypothetical protein AAGH88_15210 [Planctomycetota bacterium]